MKRGREEDSSKGMLDGIEEVRRVGNNSKRTLHLTETGGLRDVGHHQQHGHSIRRG
jgi:hypothetical protein